MNIALTREERVLLWDLLGREIDRLKGEKELSKWGTDRLDKLKVIEILIIG
jgi:hypothetical protein